MLEIPEEALENLLAALTRMNIGFVLHGTVEAAFHVMRESRLEREREKLADLGEPPTLWEWEESEVTADRASPGIPVASPVEPLRAPSTGPIPLGGASLPSADIPQAGAPPPHPRGRRWRPPCGNSASGIANASAPVPNSWLPSKHGWRGNPSPRWQQKTGGGWWRISGRSSATPPTEPPSEQRPAGRKPWRRRPRGNKRKKRRPDAVRRPGRNWIVSLLGDHGFYPASIRFMPLRAYHILQKRWNGTLLPWATTYQIGRGLEKFSARWRSAFPITLEKHPSAATISRRDREFKERHSPW